jgi:hypothetical protein
VHIPTVLSAIESIQLRWMENTIKTTSYAN